MCKMLRDAGWVNWQAEGTDKGEPEQDGENTCEEASFTHDAVTDIVDSVCSAWCTNCRSFRSQILTCLGKTLMC